MSGLPKDKRTQVAEALNWLEKHFPEFNDMIYEIRQGQKATPPKLKRIKIEGGGENEYFKEQDRLTLTLEPSYYVGLDGKVYKNSLQEILVHELMHGVQKTRSEDMAQSFDAEGKIAIEGITERNFRRYLMGAGVPESTLQSYVDLAKRGDLHEPPPAITARKEETLYESMAQSLFQKNREYVESRSTFEDHAMDTENILKQVLGKAARGHYYDHDVINFSKFPSEGSVEIETESPAQIRARGHQTWEVDSNTLIPPFIHGERGVVKSSVQEMQKNWNETHNEDTKNISADEWRVIEEVKGALLPPEIFKKKISTADEKKIDAMMEEVNAVINTLKKTFNSTAGNDVLDEKSQQLLREKGLGSLVEKTSQPGWKL